MPPEPRNGSLAKTQQAEVWSAAAIYLDGRIQSNDNEKPGRKPDFSVEGGRAVRAVLEELSGVRLQFHDGLGAPGSMQKASHPYPVHDISAVSMTPPQPRFTSPQPPMASPPSRSSPRSPAFSAPRPTAIHGASQGGAVSAPPPRSAYSAPPPPPPAAMPALTGLMAFLNPMANPLTNGGNQPQWDYLQQLLERDGQGGAHADGAAAGFSQVAREEAARKLIKNHLFVLRDVTNQVPGTQVHLARVPISSATFVDEALREVTRRLLGRREGLEGHAVQVDQGNALQAEAWAGTARYLDGRIQTHDDEKPGRTPDLSVEAGKAMRAVLEEVGGVKLMHHDGLNPMSNGFNQPLWAALLELSRRDAPAGAQADGAAGGFSQAAREEAAAALIGNHENVLKDVCNPSRTDNIIGVPLTQTHLKRVDVGHAYYVDQMLRECVRRLLGRRPGSQALAVPPEPRNGSLSQTTQMVAYACATTYLDGRIQSTDAQKPGRKPDMSEPATAAVMAVLRELASGQ